MTIREQSDGDEEESPCDTLVLAAGPWLGKLSDIVLGQDLEHKMEVTGTQAYPIVLHTQATLTPHAVLLSSSMRSRMRMS